MQRRWTITTWNLQGSAGVDVDRVANELTDRSPDVVVVQEIRRHQLRRLARRLGWRSTWHRKHSPYGPLLWWTAEGMALLTPHRISQGGAVSLTPGTSRWTYRHRIVVQALVERADGTAYRVVDVHLASDADGATARLDQATLVRDLVRSAGPAPVVIAGDLNDAGESGVVEVLSDGCRVDGWTAAATRSEGPGWTNPSAAPHQRLDHVLVPDEVTVVSADVPAGGEDWAALSDHLPLTVVFDQRWADGDFI